MPRSSHSEDQNTSNRSPCLATSTQCLRQRDRLAIHHIRRSNETKETLSTRISLVEYYTISMVFLQEPVRGIYYGHCLALLQDVKMNFGSALDRMIPQTEGGRKQSLLSKEDQCFIGLRTSLGTDYAVSLADDFVNSRGAICFSQVFEKTGKL